MIEIDFAIKTKEIIPNYVVSQNKSKRLFDENGKLHSYNDLPASIWRDGTKFWYKHGKLHRDNGLPSVIRPDGGSTEYHENGKRIK